MSEKSGRLGIRTLGTLLMYTHFPGVPIKPLLQPSEDKYEWKGCKFRLFSAQFKIQYPCLMRTFLSLITSNQLYALGIHIDPLSSIQNTQLLNKRMNPLINFGV